jgi:hypothetical protein
MTATPSVHERLVVAVISGCELHLGGEDLPAREIFELMRGLGLEQTARTNGVRTEIW